MPARRTINERTNDLGVKRKERKDNNRLRLTVVAQDETGTIDTIIYMYVLHTNKWSKVVLAPDLCGCKILDWLVKKKRKKRKKSNLVRSPYPHNLWSHIVNFMTIIIVLKSLFWLSPLFLLCLICRCTFKLALHHLQTRLRARFDRSSVAIR